MSRYRAVPPLALLVALAVPTATAAQRCPAGTGLGAEVVAAAVHYGVAGGLDGTEIGAAVRADLAAVAASVSYARLTLDRGEVDPDVLRAELGFRLLEFAGFRLCGLGLGGVSLLDASRDEDTDARILAGGVGAVVTRPVRMGGGWLRPFLAVRGSAASSSGSVLGLDVGESGLSLGADVGATLDWGALAVSAGAYFDGFAPALGVTPYPDRAIRVALGVRF